MRSARLDGHSLSKCVIPFGGSAWGSLFAHTCMCTRAFTQITKLEDSEAGRRLQQCPVALIIKSEFPVSKSHLPRRGVMEPDRRDVWAPKQSEFLAWQGLMPLPVLGGPPSPGSGSGQRGLCHLSQSRLLATSIGALSVHHTGPSPFPNTDCICASTQGAPSTAPRADFAHPAPPK